VTGVAKRDPTPLVKSFDNFQSLTFPQLILTTIQVLTFQPIPIQGVAWGVPTSTAAVADHSCTNEPALKHLCMSYLLLQQFQWGFPQPTCKTLSLEYWTSLHSMYASLP